MSGPGLRGLVKVDWRFRSSESAPCGVPGVKLRAAGIHPDLQVNSAGTRQEFGREVERRKGDSAGISVVKRGVEKRFWRGVGGREDELSRESRG